MNFELHMLPKLLHNHENTCTAHVLLNEKFPMYSQKITNIAYQFYTVLVTSFKSAHG